MTNRFFNILLLFLFLNQLLLAQETGRTQTIKGKIVDVQSKYPIEGAAVLLLNVDPPVTAISDAEGEYKLINVPLGRQTIKISSLGYNPRTIPNVVVTSGKEVILNIELEEQIVETEEVVVTAERDKTKPNNDNTSVSTRSFNMEETNRYAGSRNDPARMAMNFAGVSGANDGRNDIIIRGNSPLGVLWRMEGVDIPSPNHFGAFGTSGGAISILNNNTLGRSDFMTGAFPAQYGNALAGVFDLQMRKGNNEKREYMLQAGFLGLEAGLEGPFSKKHKSSYMASYRYSTLGILKALGFNFGTSALPQYQDLSFKIELPTKNAGKFTLFGVGGISEALTKGDKTDSTDLYVDRGYNVLFKTQMGVVGISHLVFLDDKTFSKLSFAVSGSLAKIKNDSIPQDSLGNFIPQDANGNFTGEAITSYVSIFGQSKYSLNYMLNRKFNAKNNVSVGFIGDFLNSRLTDSLLVNRTKFVTLHDFKGHSFLFQGYLQWQHRFTEKFTLNTGIHYQHFLFNNTNALEPRAGLKYQLTPKQTISFGSGLHSQLQPLQVYFREDTLAGGGYAKSNTKLGFTKSVQAVLAYDYNIFKDFRIKVETYYQYLYNVPIEQTPSSFSMLNSGADFIISTRDSLVNEGTGRNYGIEFTIEKFFSKGYYFLITTSIFDSRYKGSDGVLRNTAFNSHYTSNLLAGKEFRIGKNSVFITDLKITYAGGRRYTPVDFEASRAAQQTVYVDSLAFSEQFDYYLRTDFKIGFRANSKKVTHELSLDIQNIFNRQNPFIVKFNIQKQIVTTIPQLGLIPILQYRLTF
jgi:hypothetical protein